MSLALALLLALQAAAQPPLQPVPAPAVVAGEWDLTFDSPQASNTARIAIKQDDDRVSASLNVPLGTVQLSGNEAADGTLRMTGTVQLQGTSIPFAFSARVTGETMTGLVTLGSLAELPFTGKRPDKAAASDSPPTAASTDQPQTVTGKWQVTLAVANFGPLLVSAVLDQQGDRVTGTLNSPLGALAVTGAMTGAKLQLECVAETPQGNITVVLTGQLGPDGLTGKATVSGIGEADWKGVREK